MLAAALWIGGVVVTLFMIDRLALWAEERGWIYWRRKKAQTGAMSSMLMEMNVITNPSAQHVIEAKDAKKLEERENDDPPHA
ncbi:MAG: hypothetical protein IT547_11430 [Hyphomonadaceae bacterium]|nr:hypothetical protein [Hyphomonadaceae bacterium]